MISYFIKRDVTINIYGCVFNTASIFQLGYISKFVLGPDSHSNISSRFDIYATQPAVECLDIDLGYNLKILQRETVWINLFRRTLTHRSLVLSFV